MNPDRQVVRILFMGSDQFAVPALQALIAAESREDGARSVATLKIVGVVTAPDRPRGRGRKPSTAPPKQVAKAAGIAVLQPERLRNPASLDPVLAMAPDLVVVASYGQILPKRFLDAPVHGSLNLHPSLLPRFRGPSPIAGAILAGESETGVTLMQMNEHMDEGPIVAQASTAMRKEETAGELEARLAVLAANLLMQNVDSWLSGSLEARPQASDDATYTRLLRKSDGLIEWTQTAAELARRVNAFNPWPTAYTLWKGRQVRVLRAVAGEGAGRPGRVLEVSPEGALIGTGEGVLCARELQMQGARPLTAADFARGQRDLVGSTLG